MYTRYIYIQFYIYIYIHTHNHLQNLMAAFVDDDEDESLPTTPGTVDKVMQSSPEEYADSTQVISYFH